MMANTFQVFQSGSSFFAFAHSIVEVSNVAESELTDESVIITWDTDVASTSQIEYGETTAYGSTTTLSSDEVTEHSQQITGLTAATTYHYRVKSTVNDATGYSADGDFTTSGSPPAGANLLLSENFDDQAITSPFRVVNSSLTNLSAPADFTYETGRGGSGYCIQNSGAGAGADVQCYIAGADIEVDDEFYVSFWIRFPAFTPCSYFNMKLFYPHFTHVSGNSYVHFALADMSYPVDSSTDSAYYSAASDGVMLETGGNVELPGLSDGDWHQCEFYVQFSTGIVRCWFDGVLRLNRAYGGGYWTGLGYIKGPAEDASGGGGYQTFTRQVDDYLVYDGMP